ncbi:MAG TPA: NAD-dependent epimerase/dehydratase family protein [Glaciihabitans sp.]|jgi:dTDP-glucose 4,6-dehydratase|nr:NAD-dependent epimerase/dehydratase family protein [Glaciihabitans sp.]
MPAIDEVLTRWMPVGQWRRVMVTGGAGFVGSHLCDALVETGIDVLCVDNFSTGSHQNISPLRSRNNFHLVEADVTVGVGTHLPVDAILHAASPASVVDFYLSPERSLSALSTGILTTLAYAQRHRARFVLISAAEATNDKNHLGEGDPTDPVELYRLARRFAESITANARSLMGADTCVVRLYSTFGPRMREDAGFVLPELVRQALNRVPVTVAGSGSKLVPLCYIADVVSGVLAAAMHPVPGPVEIGSTGGVPLAALAQRVIDVAGSTSPINFSPYALHAPAPIADTVLARELLGWTCRVSLEDGLATTIQAMREANSVA